jgi:energy-coupling factor transporter ATP-binding protein EcfA2
VTLQSPEVLLESLNNALRHLRGACTDLGNEEIDDKLLDVMRRLLLAQVLGDTWVVAIGGSQGAGKTTLMACLYGLLDVTDKWLEGNEGRGEKMPVLVLEQGGLQHAQGFVRRLVKDDGVSSFTLQDVQVEVAEFQRVISDPSTGDLLPVLRVPRRYFKRDNQAWLLLPGYEKQDRDNRAWQQLMRQAMVAAGGCIVVTDKTRMANQQQVEIVTDMLEGELAGVKPYVVVTKTEDSREDPAERQQLRNSAQTTFKIPVEAAEHHIILTGTDDPDYVAHWMPYMERAIHDLNFTGQANRHLQMSDLSELAGKDLTRVLNLIRAKAQLYFSTDESAEGAQVLNTVLGEFDDAAQSLRDEHLELVGDLANQALVKASDTLDRALKDHHEGFQNWISNVFDTTSETKMKMREVVKQAWKSGASQLFTEYSEKLAQLTAKRLGREDKAPGAGAPKLLLAPEQARSLMHVGYMHSSGHMVSFKELTPEIANDVRLLLGHPSQEDARVLQETSKALSKSVGLIPAISLEYTRLVYALPEVVGLKEGVVPADVAPVGNLVEDGVKSLGTGVELGKTAIRSLATVMAVDVVSDGKADILATIFGNTQSSDGTTVPVVPTTLHPAAVAAAAAVAATYLTAVAVTRLRTFEKAASAQAHTMLHSVHDAHVAHLRKQFDDTMAVARARIVDALRARYKMDEVLMRKDRLARAMADVKSLTSDLRHDLDASAAGLHVFATGRGA